MMNRKKNINIKTIALAFALLGMLVFLCACAPKKEEIEIIDLSLLNISTPEKVEVFNDEERKLLEIWKEHKKINDDYVGEIIFDSGIINLPFVQGEDNSCYERTNFETMEYDEEGSIFMESLCNIDSSNITIYGHYVYPSIDPEQNHKFSPLAKLLEEENYLDNSTLKIVLENEIRYYKIAYVYLIPLSYSDTLGYYVEQDKLFYIPEFTKEYFDNYISFIKEQALYDTSVDITFEDKILTLQTCVINRNDLREIIICKEITRKSD